jgi:hypothetical protein
MLASDDFVAKVGGMFNTPNLIAHVALQLVSIVGMV